MKCSPVLPGSHKTTLGFMPYNAKPLCDGLCYIRCCFVYEDAYLRFKHEKDRGWSKLDLKDYGLVGDRICKSSIPETVFRDTKN